MENYNYREALIQDMGLQNIVREVNYSLNFFKPLITLIA